MAEAGFGIRKLEGASIKRLFEMTRIINSNFDLDHILKVLVDAIAGEIAGADLVGYFRPEAHGVFRGYLGNQLPVDITQLTIDPREDAFVRGILETGRSDYIPDTARDPRADPEKLRLLHIQSLFGVPMVVNGDVIGLIFVHDFGKPMNLAPEQIELVEAFVNMASVAVKNIRMFDETARLVDRQKLLLDAASALSASLSTQDVLSACFLYTGRAIGSGDVAIHIHDESDHTFRPYHISGDSHFTESEWRRRHRESVRITLEDDLLFREIVAEKRPIAIADVSADPRPNHEACRIFDIHSMMLIPLVAKGRVFGAVAIVSVGRARTYTQEEIEFCQSIADMTATALSNALHAENLDALVRERTAELTQANLKLEEYVKELRDLDEMKSDFIASLSHELRTPITAIKGTVEILQRGILGEVSGPQRELLTTAEKATERLLNQVNDLLDFSKLESGKFELTYAAASWDGLVQEAARIVQPLAERKRQGLAVEAGAGVEVRVDRQRMLQVLLNLLSNANKYTPEGGRIGIRSWVEGDSAVAAVWDTGIGIPGDKQKNIFSKFYQVDNVVSGTGLGLSIVKQLTELHGGHVGFESAPGRGTTFTVTVPLRQHYDKSITRL